ncbi:MAG TPA: hypothetical protein VD694_08005, partial [Nitrososphaeraceae archaeon]|nr:hypothetical protein [Nitrososphaeraceae archaeon]
GKVNEGADKGSGLIKAGTEFGVVNGGRILGKLKAGGEVGVKENKKGSGKFKADINLGLESDSLGELKDGSDYAVDKIKSGLKVVMKKIEKTRR